MSYTVTKLRRAEDGWWVARITGEDGRTVNVDRRYGSWQAEVPESRGSRRRVRRFVLAPAAVVLQAKVRTIEARERRNGGGGG